MRAKGDGQATQCHSFGFRQQRLETYLQQCQTLHPFGAAISGSPIGEWHAAKSLAAPSKQPKEPFYKQLMQPNGLQHAICVRAFDDGHNEVLMTFQRPDTAEAFERDDVDLLNRLSPHIELTFRLSTEFSRLRMQAAVARQALDRLAAPLWVVDAEGAVIFANRAAEEGGVPGIAVRLGRLVADAPNNHTRLATLLQQACAAKSQSGALSLERPEGGRLSVMVSPLPADSPLVADSRRPLVLLMVHDPSASDEQPLDVLAALYGLSPAECRLAAVLLEGLTMAEAAERLSVRISTIRTQVKSMFWKTGTHRQAELMKLLSGALILKI